MMITVTGLTKRYGDVVAVDDVSFEVRPGLVTGFLGPNGAGKSTTMRMILGLDAPTVTAILLGAVAVSAFGVIGVGLGTLVQRASVANILIALVVIGGQIVGSAIPSASQRYLPFNALQATVTVERSDGLLAPVPAVAFIVGYSVVAIAAANFVIRRRDV